MNLREPIAVLGPILLLAALILSFVTRPAPVQVREVVTEKETKSFTIREVRTVCHNDFQHWAVLYGGNGWFIVPAPALSSSKSKDITLMHGVRCDGTEAIHPGKKKEEK